MSRWNSDLPLAVGRKTFIISQPFDYIFYIMAFKKCIYKLQVFGIFNNDTYNMKQKIDHYSTQIFRVAVTNLSLRHMISY